MANEKSVSSIVSKIEVNKTLNQLPFELKIEKVDGIDCIVFPPLPIQNVLSNSLLNVSVYSTGGNKRSNLTNNGQPIKIGINAFCERTDLTPAEKIQLEAAAKLKKLNK